MGCMSNFYLMLNLADSMSRIVRSCLLPRATGVRRALSKLFYAVRQPIPPAASSLHPHRFSHKMQPRQKDGKAAAALHLLYINVCNSVGNRAFLNLRWHGVSHYFAVAITGTQYPATAFLQNRPHAIPHPNFCKPMPPRSVGRPRNSQGALAPPESLPGRRARPSGRPRRHLAGGHKKSPARTMRLGRGGNGRRPTLPPYEGQYHRRGRA